MPLGLWCGRSSVGRDGGEALPEQQHREDHPQQVEEDKVDPEKERVADVKAWAPREPFGAKGHPTWWAGHGAGQRWEYRGAREETGVRLTNLHRAHTC